MFTNFHVMSYCISIQILCHLLSQLNANFNNFFSAFKKYRLFTNNGSPNTSHAINYNHIFSFKHFVLNISTYTLSYIAKHVYVCTWTWDANPILRRHGPPEKVMFIKNVIFNQLAVHAYPIKQDPEIHTRIPDVSFSTQKSLVHSKSKTGAHFWEYS